MRRFLSYSVPVPFLRVFVLRSENSQIKAEFCRICGTLNINLHFGGFCINMLYIYFLQMKVNHSILHENSFSVSFSLPEFHWGQWKWWMGSAVVALVLVRICYLPMGVCSTSDHVSTYFLQPLACVS